MNKRELARLMSMMTLIELQKYVGQTSWLGNDVVRAIAIGEVLDILEHLELTEAHLTAECN